MTGTNRGAKLKISVVMSLIINRGDNSIYPFLFIVTRTTKEVRLSLLKSLSCLLLLKNPAFSFRCKEKKILKSMFGNMVNLKSFQKARHSLLSLVDTYLHVKLLPLLHLLMELKFYFLLSSGDFL